MKNRTPALIVLTLISTSSISEETIRLSEPYMIPKGIYVFSDNPPCGAEPRVNKALNDPMIAKSIATLFGPKVSAITILITQANSVLSQSGGDLSKLFRQATENKDHASCQTKCLKFPKNFRPVKIELSNRGASTWKYDTDSNGELSIENLSTGDWSGWRNVFIKRGEDIRWFACGTATNWSNDQDASKFFTVILESE